MKINFEKIINIKTLNDLKKFNLKEPLFFNNYLFHYLIMFNKLDILKLETFPIYKENDDGLNGFFLAAKYNNIDTLKYLIKTYPEYIYNKNENDELFLDYLDFDKIIKLLDTKLNWDLLLKNKIDELFYNLEFDDIMKLLLIYKPKNHYLNLIVSNPSFNVKQIIKLLELFPNEIQLRDIDDETLIFPALHRKDIQLVNYIISKNVNINYYTLINTYHPLKTAFNIGFMEAYNIIWKNIKSQFDYNLTNRNLENILHYLLKNNIDDKTSMEIIENAPSSAWNQLDVNKVKPVELLLNYDFLKYNKIIENKQVILPLDFEKKINNENSKLWLKLLQSLPKYVEVVNINVEKYPYSHANLFQSKFKDMTFYILHLKKKYSTLYYPNIDDFTLENLTDLDDINLDWPDPLLENNNMFPWIICYQNEEEFWIHSNLNNLINAQRRTKKYDFAICYLSLKMLNDGLHANIIIYDFNNMTIERFDPYGDTVHFDKELDNVLEEELTWNTGFTYLKPSDYMPVAGFQTVSDELNPYKQKSGDFGGYCLAWCTWYLEHRIKNKNIKPKDLVTKLLKILSQDNDTFMEYIRNYANKLNEVRTTYLLDAGMNIKTISNITYGNNIENSLSNYIINKI
uniref:Ankyrin repeat protein n=1 Tax=viral metagenome TaxID=1070528 RepID=A0A6C0DAC8_9ZZZZ